MALTAAILPTLEINAESKTINIFVSGTPGGGYDIYARFYMKHLIAQKLGMPVTIKYLPGAAGMVAAHHALTDADDGNFNLYMLQTNQFARHTAPDNFDPRKFKLIGGMVTPNFILQCNADAPWNWSDLIIGTVAPGNPPHDYAQMLNKLLKQYAGTSFKKIVTGYAGTRELLTAVEKNEVHGMIWDVSSAKAAVPDWFYTPGKHQILLQFGPIIDPTIPAPIIDLSGHMVLGGKEYLLSSEDTKAVRLILAQQMFSKTFVMPPNVSEGRETLMGLAFIEICWSDLFKDDARRHNIEINPIGPTPLEKLLNESWNQPREVVERAVELCKP